MTDGLFDNRMVHRFSFFSYTFPVVRSRNETLHVHLFLPGQRAGQDKVDIGAFQFSLPILLKPPTGLHVR